MKNHFDKELFEQKLSRYNSSSLGVYINNILDWEYFNEVHKVESRRTAIRLLFRRFGGRDYILNSNNYYIWVYYDEDGTPEVSVTWEAHGANTGTIYFDTREDALVAIEMIGEDRIIKSLTGDGGEYENNNSQFNP